MTDMPKNIWIPPVALEKYGRIGKISNKDTKYTNTEKLIEDLRGMENKVFIPDRDDIRKGYNNALIDVIEMLKD